MHANTVTGDGPGSPEKKGANEKGNKIKKRKKAKNLKSTCSKVRTGTQGGKRKKK